jgi:hypothetical protein
MPFPFHAALRGGQNPASDLQILFISIIFDSIAPESTYLQNSILWLK